MRNGSRRIDRPVKHRLNNGVIKLLKCDWLTEKDADGNYIPSPKPLPLNPDGSLKTSGDPAILQRPVYREIDFSTYFGSPPV